MSVSLVQLPPTVPESDRLKSSAKTCVYALAGALAGQVPIGGFVPSDSAAMEDVAIASVSMVAIMCFTAFLFVF